MAQLFQPIKNEQFATGLYTETWDVEFGKPISLNGVLRVPVTMAAEMVQPYHISEVDFLKEVVGPDTIAVPIYKPFEELANAIKDLNQRAIEKLPFVVPHSKGTFLKEQVPKEYADYIQEYVTEAEVKGYVRDFKIDYVQRKIKGDLYITISKNTPEFLTDVKEGKVINVSIGFCCEFHVEDGWFDDRHYVAIQRKIQLGHLAGLPHQVGKCPAGICGINQDSSSQFHGHPHQVAMIDRSKPIIQQKPLEITDPTVEKITTHYVDGSTKILHEGVPKYPDHDHNINSRSSSMNEEELKKLLEAKDAQISTLSKDLQSFKDSKFSEQLKDLNGKVNDLNTQLIATQKVADLNASEAKDAKAKLAEKEQKLKEIEEAEAQKDRTFLASKFGGMDANWGPTGKKIKDLCAHDARVAVITLTIQADANLAVGGIPKAPAGQQNVPHVGQNMDALVCGSTEPKPELVK